MPQDYPNQAHTKLASKICPNGGCKNITPKMISKTLKTSVKVCGPDMGFEAKDVSTHSIGDIGAMALL